MRLSQKYVVITPIRDEEAHIEKTISAVLSQTVPPVEWVIVNDGSSDRTGSIIDQFATLHSWIHPVHRANRGFRSAGAGVIEAFDAGYHAMRTENWDYIVKLDGDLSFDRNYFEKCFDYFNEAQELGIGGGAIYNLVNGVPSLERHPKFHVRGATKIYRRACWDAIGGLIMAPGWDTLDEVKANMLGWRSRTFSDLKVVHYRYTGAADGQWSSFVKYGRANYISGYHPLFMLLKCLKRTVQHPIVLGALGLFYGYMSGYFKRIPRVDDRALIAYLRKQQLNKIFQRKTIWE